MIRTIAVHAIMIICTTVLGFVFAWGLLSGLG